MNTCNVCVFLKKINNYLPSKMSPGQLKMKTVLAWNWAMLKIPTEEGMALSAIYHILYKEEWRDKVYFG